MAYFGKNEGQSAAMPTSTEDAFVDQAVSEQSENILAEPNKAAFSNLQRGMIDEFEALKEAKILKEKQERGPSSPYVSTTLRDRSNSPILEDMEILKRWANYRDNQFGSPLPQGNIDSTMLNQDPLGVLDPGNIPQEGVGGNKNNRSQGGKQ